MNSPSKRVKNQLDLSPTYGFRRVVFEGLQQTYCPIISTSKKCRSMTFHQNLFKVKKQGKKAHFCTYWMIQIFPENSDSITVFLLRCVQCAVLQTAFQFPATSAPSCVFLDHRAVFQFPTASAPLVQTIGRRPWTSAPSGPSVLIPDT